MTAQIKKKKTYLDFMKFNKALHGFLSIYIFLMIANLYGNLFLTSKFGGKLVFTSNLA